MVGYFQRLKGHQAFTDDEDEEEAEESKITTLPNSGGQRRPSAPDMVVSSLLEMLNSPSHGAALSPLTREVEWEPLSERILNHVMSVFINEFQDVIF